MGDSLGCVIRGGDSPTQTARVHPLTLYFDDDELEAEFRNIQLHNSLVVLGCTGSVLFICLEMSGYGRSPLQLISFAVFCTFLGVAFRGTAGWVHRVDEMLGKRNRLHAILCYLWIAIFTANITAWWWLTYRGTIQRLDPSDFRKIAACCGVWTVITVVQHVLIVPFGQRILVIYYGLTIALSGDVREALMTSIVVGELFGYALEHHLRSNLLVVDELRSEKELTVKRLKREKERALYDLALAQHRAKNSEGGSIRSPSLTSLGTNSELAASSASKKARSNSSSGAASTHSFISEPELTSLADTIAAEEVA